MATYNAMTGEFDFPMAIDVLRRGERVRRSGWGSAYVVLKDGGFYMFMPNRNRDAAWVPTWDEMLARDWTEVVNEH